MEGADMADRDDLIRERAYRPAIKQQQPVAFRYGTEDREQTEREQDHVEALDRANVSAPSHASTNRSARFDCRRPNGL
jgi:hypothetical protein